MLKTMKLALLLLFVPAINLCAQNPNREANAARRAARMGQPTANLLRGPYLQAATSNSIVIRWRTDNWSRTRVRYGTTPDNLTITADDSTLVTEHQVKLSGLQPKTRYYYAIGGFNDTLQHGADNYFETLPLAGTEALYRIGVFGDCGNISPIQKEVRDQVINYLGENYMDAWILLGDNAYQDGNDFQYQTKFFDIYKDNLLKKYPLFPAPGNHDYYDRELSTAHAQRTKEVPYYKNFTMPVNGEAGGVPSHNPAYYSFDIGNIHFLSLDSYGIEEGSLRLYHEESPQVQWIRKDLENNKNKGWVVAFWHHPPYTMGSHNSDNEDELVQIRGRFIQILEKYGVDLILCGHSHLYERSRIMKGHYGAESTFNAAKHNLSQSSALYNSSKNACPYIKNDDDNQGTVYVVSGSAGQLSKRVQPTYPHDAFFYSNNEVGGAVMLEVQANRLDLKWICADGVIRDQFTMMKNVNKRTRIQLKRGETVTLTASYIGNYNWSSGKEKTKSIVVSPPVGKSTYVVKDEFSCVQDSFEITVSR